MSLQVGLNNSQSPIVVQPNVDSKLNKSSASFKGHASEPEASTKVKVGSLLTTLVGVGTAMYLTFKKNPTSGFKGFKEADSVKKYFKAFAKIKYNEHEDELAWTVARLGVGSVAGGLLGGAIFDKKDNFMAKCRESVIQLVGNIATPLIFVAGGGKLFEKHFAPKIIEKLKLNTFKWDKAQKIPQMVAQTGLLVAGIFAGNSLGNTINKNCFKVDEKRKIKLSDMSPHIDDVCVSASLVFKESELISKFVPPALTIAGYSVGTAQEAPLRVAQKKAKQAEKMAIKQQKIQANQQKVNV